MIPYVPGNSEDIKHVSGKLGMKVVYRSGQALCSLLTRVNEEMTTTRELI